MSENVLVLVPADPYRVPTSAEAQNVRDLVLRLLPPIAGRDSRIQVDWYDSPMFVDCGSNLERILCPHCDELIDVAWWVASLEERSHTDFANLDVVTPCCSAVASLDGLRYDKPCGFSRFKFALWNPPRERFDDDELKLLAEAFGHPLRQFLARY